MGHSGGSGVSVGVLGKALLFQFTFFILGKGISSGHQESVANKV